MSLEKSILPLYQASTVEELGEALDGFCRGHLPYQAMVLGFSPATYIRDVFVRPEKFRPNAQRYVDEDYRLDVWLSRSPVNPHVVAVRHSDYTPTETLIKSPFYTQVLQPINSTYGASIVAWAKTDWLAMLTLHHSIKMGDFTEEEMALLRFLQPHFRDVVRRLAAENIQRIRQDSLDAVAAHFPHGFALLRYSAKVMQVIQCNAAARSYFHAEVQENLFDLRKHKLPRKPVIPPELVAAITRMRQEMESSKPRPKTEQRREFASLRVPDLIYRVTYMPEKAHRGMREGLFLVVMDRNTDEASPELSLLTPREKEVAHLLTLGKTNQEIATALNKSVATVRHQITSIFAKLKVKNRNEASRILR